MLRLAGSRLRTIFRLEGQLATPYFN